MSGSHRVLAWALSASCGAAIGSIASCSGQASNGTDAGPEAARPDDSGVDVRTQKDARLDARETGSPMHDASDATDVPTSDGALTAPAPAAAAGFTKLVFEDDFTSEDTIAPTQSAASGYNCQIQTSTDLTNWQVVTNIASETGTVQFTDTNALDFSQRFYRAVLTY